MPTLDTTDGVLSSESERTRGGDHYLKNEALRQVIKENWPDIKMSDLDKITEPGISDNSDDLERWEYGMRKERIKEIISLDRNPLEKLQILLYEECFGVNASPGRDVQFKDSLAPSPGGLISHGYPHAIVNGYDLEKVSKLDFAGKNAMEATNSLSDSQRRGMISIMAEIAYPVISRLGASYITEMNKRTLEKKLGTGSGQIDDEVENWAFRLIDMIHKSPSMTRKIEDPRLKRIIGVKEHVNHPLILAWTMLWGKMSNNFLRRLDDGTSVYREVGEVEKQAIGDLLYARLHPDTQILFKYHSPSGYVNEHSR